MPDIDKTLLNKMERFFSALDGESLTKQEFVDNWETILKQYKQLESKMLKAISGLEENYNLAQNKLHSDGEMSRSEMREMVQGELKTMMAEFRTRMAQIDEKMSEVMEARGVDEKAILEALKAQIDIPEYKETILDGPEQLRDKLESLQGDARPVWVTELEKQLAETREMATKALTRRMPPGVSADAVLSYDLSSQCDGSTTTFIVPRHRQALLLIGTQFPHIYRPTTDFTTANLQLSLVTSQVSAPASGQTLIFLYRK